MPLPGNNQNNQIVNPHEGEQKVEIHIEEDSA